MSHSSQLMGPTRLSSCKKIKLYLLFLMKPSELKYLVSISNYSTQPIGIVPILNGLFMDFFLGGVGEKEHGNARFCASVSQIL